MSMYAVNAGIPKTLVRHLVSFISDDKGSEDPKLSAVLDDILDTPVSPELLPAIEGKISQRTEDLVGPYELHDFFLYYAVRWGFPPRKVFRLAEHALGRTYDRATILKWLNNFYRRFFTQQFKRSCLPDGPKVGSLTPSPCPPAATGGCPAMLCPPCGWRSWRACNNAGYSLARSAGGGSGACADEAGNKFDLNKGS